MVCPRACSRTRIHPCPPSAPLAFLSLFARQFRTHTPRPALYYTTTAPTLYTTIFYDFVKSMKNVDGFPPLSLLSFVVLLLLLFVEYLSAYGERERASFFLRYFDTLLRSIFFPFFVLDRKNIYIFIFLDNRVL